MMKKQQAQELLKELQDIINTLQTLEESQKKEIIARLDKIHDEYVTETNINDQ